MRCATCSIRAAPDQRTRKIAMAARSRPQSKARDLIASLREKDGVEVGFSALHIASGERLDIGAETVFPTASVFKVPLMVEVYGQAREGRFAMTDRLALNESQKTLPSGVLVTL